MTLKLKLTAILIIVGISTGFAQLTADEAIIEMGRGINMGNTLDATGYEGNWSLAAEEFYFDMYKEAGFKTIRIPITWHAGLSQSDPTLRLSDTSPYEVDSIFFDRLDTIINWSLARDLYTIINVHHDGWVKVSSTFDENKPRLYALWQQIAERYKDYPDKLLFEIINEPYSDNGSITTEQVNELNSKCLEIIRDQNPYRITLYGGPNWSSSADLFAASIPDSNDNYLIAYYHSYDPWSFAGEGTGTWGNSNDKTEMSDQMLRVQTWSESNSIPVLIGEFGAVNRCDYNSRMRYYAHYTEQALEHNLAFTVWDDGGDFKALDRNDSTWNDLKDILIYTTAQSATDVLASFVKGADTNIVVKWTNRAIDCDTIIIEKRINNSEFETFAKFTNDTQSVLIDTAFEVKHYYAYRVISRYNDSIDVYSYPNQVYITPLERSTFHDQPFAIPGTIEAEDFDNGGQGLTYNETTIVNQGDAQDYRAGETVDIEVRSDGGYQVGYAEEGEWLEYTINVAATASYEIVAHLASQDGGGELQFIFQNTSAIITAPKTNSWTNTQPVSTYANLVEGEQIMRVKITATPNYNIDKFEISEGTEINTTNVANWLLYPNPASNLLFISGYSESESATVDIITLNGSKVISTNTNELQNGVSIEELNTGFYLIVISNNNTVTTKQFLKQ